MTILHILEFPDPRLRTKASPVKNVNKQIQQLVDDLLETMYDAPGIGLAATQVDVHKRVLVIDISQEKDQPLVFINPEITHIDGELLEYDEGCLSVPGFYEPVKRQQNLTVKALNREGEPFDLDAEGLLAVCIQHEIDHLNGKLFVDYISALKKQRIRKKLEKEHRNRA